MDRCTIATIVITILVHKQSKSMLIPFFLLLFVADWIFYRISQIILTMFISIFLLLAVSFNRANFHRSANCAWNRERDKKNQRQDDFFEKKISKSLTLDNSVVESVANEMKKVSFFYSYAGGFSLLCVMCIFVNMYVFARARVWRYHYDFELRASECRRKKELNAFTDIWHQYCSQVHRIKYITASMYR